MKQQQFSARRRQVMAGATIGAGALAAPAVMATPLHESAGRFADGKIVVSGRVLGAHDRQALAGAQIEIWQANARGVRAEQTREVVTADGDGRYFATLTVNGDTTQRLHYRISRQGYTAKVTQMNAGAKQRSVTLTRDEAGFTRATFELTLAPKSTLAAAAPDYAAL